MRFLCSLFLGLIAAFACNPATAQNHSGSSVGSPCSCSACMVFSNDAAGRKAFQKWQSQQNTNTNFNFFNTPRWSSTATNGGGLQQGDPTTLTWSILPDGANTPNGIGEGSAPSDLVDFLDNIYHGGSSPGGSDYTQRTWWTLMDQTFNRFSELSGLSYVYEPNDDGVNFVNQGGVLGVRGDVRIAGKTLDGNSGVLAYNFGPNSGDMVIDTSDNFYNTTSNNSLRFRNVFAHEHGHGIGIAHTEPVNGTKLMEPFINLGFDGVQFDDILSTQRQYGDFFEKNGGNDTTGTAQSLGNVGDGQTVEIGADAVGLTNSLINSGTDTDFVSIDDNGDTDVLSFSILANADVSLLLTPVGPTYQEGPQGGSSSSFNTAALSDLTLELIDTDGSTVLQLANAGGLGSAESILENLGPGTYYARVTGDANTIQMYHLSVTANFTAIPEPTSIAFLGLVSLGLLSRRRRRR